MCMGLSQGFSYMFSPPEAMIPKKHINKILPPIQSPGQSPKAVYVYVCVTVVLSLKVVPNLRPHECNTAA